MFKRKLAPSEIALYVQDLQRITLLRDKSKDDERKRYDNVIKVMQLSLEVISKV